MDQRLSFLTLGVSDFARARDFYEKGLGWKPVKVMDDVAFYQGNGFVFALHPRELLAKDANLPAEGSGFGGITIAINMPDQSGVDRVMAEAAKAGGKILKPAQKVYWGGYNGYFADLDGYPWEVAWNPAITIDAEGRSVWQV